MDAVRAMSAAVDVSPMMDAVRAMSAAVDVSPMMDAVRAMSAAVDVSPMMDAVRAMSVAMGEVDLSLIGPSFAEQAMKSACERPSIEQIVMREDLDEYIGDAIETERRFAELVDELGVADAHANTESSGWDVISLAYRGADEQPRRLICAPVAAAVGIAFWVCNAMLDGAFSPTDAIVAAVAFYGWMRRK